MTLHGILPVHKPKGLTSHDVVARIRRIAGQKRVGHTGTLDPEVDGVLPICLGQATRIVDFLQARPKRYTGTMKLGIATDTEDQTGNVTARSSVHEMTPDKIESAFSSLLGVIEQIPPMYSAVKIKGKRLYELARNGQTVERPARKVEIYHLHLIGFKQAEHPLIMFDVCCSKGTYVRTLCVDIGKKLGYPAHMYSLTRIESGPFHLADCYSLDELEEAANEGRLAELLVAIDESLHFLPSLIVDDDDGRRVLDGVPLEFTDSMKLTQPFVRVYTEQGKFCAIYRLNKTLAVPEKVFREVE